MRTLALLLSLTLTTIALAAPENIPTSQPSLGAAGMKSPETSGTTQPGILQPPQLDALSLFPTFSRGDTGPDKDLSILLPGKTVVVTKKQAGLSAALQTPSPTEADAGTLKLAPGKPLPSPSAQSLTYNDTTSPVALAAELPPTSPSNPWLLPLLTGAAIAIIGILISLKIARRK